MNLQQTFSEHDGNKDGKVDGIELTAMLEKLYTGTVSRVQKSAVVEQDEPADYGSINLRLKSLQMTSRRHTRTVSDTMPVRWSQQLNSAVEMSEVIRQGGEAVSLEQFTRWIHQNARVVPFLTQLAQQECDVIAGLWQMDSSSSSSRFIISKKWFKLWQSYAKFQVEVASDQPPCSIDNFNIVADDEEFVRLKRNLQGDEYIVVNSHVWQQLFQWYGGGPVIQRFIVQDKLDLYPYVLRVGLVNNDNNYKLLVVSSYVTVDQLLSLVAQQLDIKEANDQLTFYYVNSYDSQPVLINYKLDEVVYHTSILDDSTIYVDIPKKRHVRTTTTSSLVGWLKNKSPSVLSPRENGTAIVGLQNLGNTCYMSSALQCLMHTEPLVQYMLDGYWKHDLEVSGRDGLITKEFNMLVDALYNKAKSYSCVVPLTFRKALSQKSPQFVGFDQHDSQEAVGAILDHLHMDLNFIDQTAKVTVDNPDYKGQQDNELADIYWKNYIKREASVITALFEGQFKSHAQCLNCNHQIVKFSPFMFLSLQLPEDHQRQLTVIIRLTSKPELVKCSLTVQKEGTIADLCSAANRHFGCDVEFEVADVQRSYVFSTLKLSLELSQVSTNDTLYLYEVQQGISVSVVQRMVDRSWITSGKSKTTHVFGHPLVIQLLDGQCLTGIELYEHIMHELMQSFDMSGMLVEKTTSGQFPFQLKRVQNNGLVCSDCPPQSKCTGCAIFCNSNFLDVKPYETLAAEWSNIKHRTLQSVMLAVDLDDSLNSQQIDQIGDLKLDDIIRNYEKPEYMLDYFCPNCKSQHEGIKRETVWRFPPYLMIQFKRFAYTGTGFVKNDCIIQYPTKQFNVTPYLSQNAEGQHVQLSSAIPLIRKDNTHAPLPYNKTVTKESIYDLYAQVSHLGTIYDGHYVAHWKNPVDQQWYLFNDHICKQEVLYDTSRSSWAYLLFYKKRDALEVSILKSNLMKQCM